MNDLCDDSDRSLEGMHELFSSATHDASAAMCRWTNGLITVTLDDVREIPLEEVSIALDIGAVLHPGLRGQCSPAGRHGTGADKRLSVAL